MYKLVEGKFPYYPVLLLGWVSMTCTKGLKRLGVVSQRPSASIPNLSWNLALVWTFSAV